MNVRKMAGKTLLAWMLALALGGCTQYIVRCNGANDNTIVIAPTPSKNIETTLGASVAATAAASQSGQASNSGPAAADALHTTK